MDAPATAPGAPRSYPHGRSTLALLTVASFLTPFMASSLVVALPSIGRDLGMGAVTLAWVGTSYLLAAAVCMIPVGRLADLWGRRRLFIWGIVGHALFTLALGFARSAPLFLALRALQGASGSLVFSTSVPILISVFPPAERGKALGVNIAGVYLGLALGPVLGGLLTQAFGWRSIFFVSVPIGLVVALLARRWLRPDASEAAHEAFDLPGTLLYAAGLVLLMLGMTRLPGVSGLALLGAGLAGLFAFVRWESRTSSPVLDVRLFRESPVFALSNFAALANYCATSAVGFLLSLYLQTVKGMTPREAGLVLVSQPVIMTIFTPLAGRLSDRVEPRIPATAGMALTTIGLLLLIPIHAGTPMGLIVGCLLLLGFSFALFSAPNTNAIMSSVDRRFHGVASGTLGTARIVGQMLSMGIATLLFALCIGQARIVPEVAPQFLRSTRLAFVIFAALCAAGTVASMARGRVRDQGIGAQDPRPVPRRD